MNKSKKNPPMPEHGGKSVSGGGHPSYAPTLAQKDIDAGSGYSVPGYKTLPASPTRGCREAERIRSRRVASLNPHIHTHTVNSPR